MQRGDFVPDRVATSWLALLDERRVHRPLEASDLDLDLGDPRHGSPVLIASQGRGVALGSCFRMLGEKRFPRRSEALRRVHRAEA